MHGDHETRRRRLGLRLIPPVIFLSAFLLFQMQPLLSKYLLPWFGGTAGVWTVCMVFFQTGLLAGYAYAHLLIRHVKPRAQAYVHLAVLGSAILTLPIIPPGSWKPAGSEDPTWRLPLWKPYEAMLDSKIADTNNVSTGGQGGAITAALFLKKFVTAKSWLHLDVFAWNNATKPGRPEGAECQAARALYAMLAKRYA